MNELRGRINDLNHEREREELRNPQWANELEQQMLQFQKNSRGIRGENRG